MKNKKLLIAVLMFSILLTMMFPVSAFANEEEVGFIASGQYKFNDTITVEDIYFVKIDFTVEGFNLETQQYETMTFDTMHFDNVSTTDIPNYRLDFNYYGGSTLQNSIWAYDEEFKWDCMYEFYKEIVEAEGEELPSTFENIKGIGQTIKVPKDVTYTDEKGIAFANWFNSNVSFVYDDTGPTLPPATDDTTNTLFGDYNGETLPIIPNGVNMLSSYVFISKVSAASYGYSNDYFYILDVSNTEPTVTEHTSAYCVFQYLSGGTSLYRYIYTPNSELASKLTAEGNKASSTGWGDVNVATPSTSTTYGVDAIVWSAFTIKDANGDTFFPRPSTTLTETIQTEMLEGVLTEIVTILPIGLLCGISYLALRKALAILVTLLRRA